MKRRTRKQWYQYHLNKSVGAVQAIVYEKYEAEIAQLEQLCSDVESALDIAISKAPLLSKVSEFIGVKTDYYSINIRPYESDLLVIVRALEDIYHRRAVELKQAREQGEQDYLEAREMRRQETEAREQRVAQRKYERKIRYLEESPALRSAARSLKKILIEEQVKSGEWLNCYYCQSSIPINESHLEHKRPISRGGKNTKGNLVLSCAPCNLKKGSKTAEEFIRLLGTNQAN